MSEPAPLSAPLILISSGGTGGHMSPAAALAHDLVRRGFGIALITDARGSKYASMFPEGTDTHIIRAGTISGGPAGKLKGALNLVAGFGQAWKLIRKLRPAVVVGFGGYPSVPGVLAGQIRKIPVILHEQNAVLGRANLHLAKRAARIALSFPDMSGLDERARSRAVVTGNPVRQEIAALHDAPYTPPAAGETLNILVMGGSLGASVFARVVPGALAKLPPEARASLKIVQQCRESDIESARKAYEQAGIKAGLAVFYADMAARLAAAHLIICRSGASTVAELSAAGRPAIFVPYPHHKDQQQKKNAQYLTETGGGWLMTEDVFTSEALLARIEAFLQNPDELAQAAQKSRMFGKPDAAARLGDMVAALVVS